MFLGFLDPDPNPLVRGVDPAPDPSITKQEIPSFLLFCDFFYFLSLKNVVNVPSKSNKQKNLKN
jgi:hypothetical protein